MIKKIIVLMILILISINNVNCESDSLIDNVLSDADYVFNKGQHNLYTGDFLLLLNHDSGGLPDSYSIKNIHAKNLSNYFLTPGNLGDPFYIYYSSDGTTKTELIGYGSVRIYKKSNYGNIDGSNAFNIDIYFNFDNIDGFNNELTGPQYYILGGTWNSVYTYYNLYRDGGPQYNDVYNNIYAFVGGSGIGNYVTRGVLGSQTHEYTSFGSFRNDYDYDFTTSYFDIDIQKQGFNISYDLSSSKIKMLNYTDDTIYYQSGFTTSNSSHFLGVGTYNYYIVRQIDDYEYLIYTSYEDEDEDEQPTLTTDKTYYNTSETITINFTNIDSIYNECGQSICAKPYDLHILYPVTHAYKDYESKYIYPLTYSLQDETITLSTSFLSPQNNYILGIVGINGDYHKHEDILIFSDDFVVYPDEEYLSVSCDSETACYTYNNADITIYYQINNNSNIIVKDNDNNVINTYYNIIGNGSILYHIPDDLYHENTYPNWKVYLNNTGYSTSFNKGVTVYWSQFQTPTPTPTFTPKPTPDINISDEIDNLKDEISPIKDLIFGLSEIVIDNPDYNKDNIVDESEINHWFNSLIPICIIFLLIILYIGLKKKEE